MHTILHICVHICLRPPAPPGLHPPPFLPVDCWISWHGDSTQGCVSPIPLPLWAVGARGLGILNTKDIYIYIYIYIPHPPPWAAGARGLGILKSRIYI